MEKTILLNLRKLFLIICLVLYRHVSMLMCFIENKALLSSFASVWIECHFQSVILSQEYVKIISKIIASSSLLSTTEKWEYIVNKQKNNSSKPIW